MHLGATIVLEVWNWLRRAVMRKTGPNDAESCDDKNRPKRGGSGEPALKRFRPKSQIVSFFFLFLLFFFILTTTNRYYSYTEDSGWLRWAGVEEISPKWCSRIIWATSKFFPISFVLFFILTTTYSFYSYTESSGWLRWAGVDKILLKWCSKWIFFSFW